MASPTGSRDGARSDSLHTSVTVTSTQGDEYFKESVDFRLTADVVRRRRCLLSSNSDGQQLTRSINLEHVLVSLVISHVDDRVAREM